MRQEGSKVNVFQYLVSVSVVFVFYEWGLEKLQYYPSLDDQSSLWT